MIDFILSALVAPVVTRFGVRVFDAAADSLDDTVRPLLHRFVEGVEASELDCTHEAETARAELISYAAQHPETEAQLTAALREAVEGADAASDPLTARLHQLHRLLTFLLDRCAALRRPVALPGFLNSIACVSVIDTRTAGSRYQPDELNLPPEPDAELQRIVLGTWDGAYDAQQYGYPRIWLLRTAEDARDEIVDRWNTVFARPLRNIPSFVTADGFEHNPPAELVTSIAPDWVEIWRPRRQVQGSLADRVLDSLTIDPDPVESDDFYQIRGSEGWRLMRGHLETLLRERWEEDDEWREAALSLDAAAPPSTLQHPRSAGGSLA